MDKETKKFSGIANCWNTIGVWSCARKKCDKLTEYIHCRNCPVFLEVGHSVFEKVAPSGYLSQWRKEISAKKNVDNPRNNSVLVFRVGHEWFALPSVILGEIANERIIHRIPRNMNRFISGIVNINGEIKVCYSLSELLGLSSVNGENKKEDNYNPRRLIVINLDEKDYVFLVDEVKGLYLYGDSDLLSVPSTLDATNALLLLGSINQSNHQVAIFNLSKFQEKLEGAVL
ncbi:MAG: chemotaxis protein CheW [Gammaproteobacteria bacterium]|nr:chemotaxis protein CheW [Gammaproteobacteria bacterium]